MSQTDGERGWWPAEAIANALGEKRFREMSKGIEGILSQADGAPAFTESLVHLPIPLKSQGEAAIASELRHLLDPEPGWNWDYVTFTRSDGRRFAKANPFVHRTPGLGPTEWAVVFTLSELFVRLGAWWSTQMWRAAELAAGVRDALNAWNIHVCAASARSLLEGAAYLNHELPILLELWDGFKTKGTPTIESLDTFVTELSDRLTSLQFSSRIGEVTRVHPEVLSKNVMTYLGKLAKQNSAVDVTNIYEWLCDAVHPSYGSTTVFRAQGLQDAARSHIVDRYERWPLELVISSTKRVQPTVAQMSAEAVILATHLLRNDLARARWVIVDLGLTGDLASSIELRSIFAYKPPGRNEQCPCGSGRKFKRCVHRWGLSGIPTVSAIDAIDAGDLTGD